MTSRTLPTAIPRQPEAACQAAWNSPRPAPRRQRLPATGSGGSAHWTTYNFAALWIGMAHNIPSWTLAAGLVALGMDWKQASSRSPWPT